MSGWAWFSGAILLSLAELLGGEFVLLMLGGGALAAAAVALLAPHLLWLQLVVFALISVGLVVGARPALLRKFHGPSQIRTGIDDLEVQRQPQGSNPSWVSMQQWARLQRVLPPPGA